MKFPARMAMSVVARMIVLACAYVTVGAWAAEAQTIHVDVTPGHAVAFDPDKAMGTSMDILPAKDFEKVYSEPDPGGLVSRLGTYLLPAEYRVDVRGVALEPEWGVEQ